MIWGYVSEEVAKVAEEDLDAIKDELRCNHIKRWEAIGTLKHVLSFVNLPWELKRHTINFLLCITDGKISAKYDDAISEWSNHMPNLFSALQVFTVVPDSTLFANAQFVTSFSTRNRKCLYIASLIIKHCLSGC